MDTMDQRRREPAYEDTQAYLDLCARHGTTPIVRPTDGRQAYVCADDSLPTSRQERTGRPQ